MADNVYQHNAFLQMLSEKKDLIDGGNSIVQPVMVTKQDDGGFYLGADVLNNTQKNFANQVEYLWQNAYEPIQLTRDEERQNSGSEHKILSLLGAKMKSSELAIADRLEQAFSNPTANANNLIDINTLTSTGSLGSISGSTVTAWQATVVTSGPFVTQGLSDMTTGTYLVSASATVDNRFLIFKIGNNYLANPIVDYAPTNGTLAMASQTFYCQTAVDTSNHTFVGTGTITSQGQQKIITLDYTDSYFDAVQGNNVSIPRRDIYIK
jgi:hypothetical protein